MLVIKQLLETPHAPPAAWFSIIAFKLVVVMIDEGDRVTCSRAELIVPSLIYDNGAHWWKSSWKVG